MRAGNPKTTAILIVLLLGGFILLAGCTTTVSGDTGSSGELPLEMDRVLNDVTTKLQEETNGIQTELYAAAEEIGTNPHDSARVLQILQTYYRENSWVSLIGYYDQHAEKITVPITPPSTAEEIFQSVTEKDLSSGNSIRMVFNQIQEDAAVPITAIFVPVYSAQKTYCGYIVIWYDPDRLVADLLSGLEDMETYGLWIGDVTGKETYYRTSPDYDGCPENTVYLSGWKTVEILGSMMRVCLTDDGDLQSRMLKASTAESLKSESIELYSYATTHSQKAVLNYISQKEPDTYLYVAYDTLGNVLARSDGRCVNQNQQDLHDVFGVQTLDTIVSRMRQGGGYVYVMDPTTNVQSPVTAVQTVSYLLPIDSSWFIGVQGSVYTDQVPVDSSAGLELLKLGREAAGYAWKYGQDAAVEMISREDSIFLRNGSSDSTPFMGAVTMEGVSLPDNPESAEEIRRIFGLVDTYGASVGRQEVALAKQGGGLMYYEMSVEDETGAETVVVYLVAITPVNNEWYIFTGNRIHTYSADTTST